MSTQRMYDFCWFCARVHKTKNFTQNLQFLGDENETNVCTKHSMGKKGVWRLEEWLAAQLSQDIQSRNVGLRGVPWDNERKKLNDNENQI